MRITPIVLLCGLLLFGCAAPAPDPATPDTVPPAPVPSDPVPPAVPAASNPRPEITIDVVTATNPVHIEGTARSFENNVILRIRDAQDRVMVESFTTSRGESGRHNPFAADVFLTRDPAGAITVEALEYSAKDGAERSLTRKRVPYDVPLASMTLYLPDRDCTRVDPVTRSMPKSVAAARLLVEALMREPAPFPKGAAVRSVNLREGVVTVDFNERLQNVGGACAAQMIRQSVEKTLKALPTVEDVVITAGGSRELALQP